MKSAKTSLVYLLQQAYKNAFREKYKLKPPSDGPVEGGMSRKKFIRNIALSAPALFIPDLLKAGTGFFDPSGAPAKVAIVGAGIAGLNACNILSKIPGLEVTVYEAGKRAGGRIFTAKNLLGDGITTELGAEFIDSNHETMFALVQQYQLETMDCVNDIKDNKLVEHTYHFGGKLRSEAEIIAEFKKMIPQLQKDKTDMEIEELGRELDKLSLKDYLEKFDLRPWFSSLLYWAFTAEFGMEADELNCLNFIDLIGINENKFDIFGDSDERYKIKGGNETLIEAMVKDLAAQIKYSHKLTKISKIGEESILHFEDGSTVQAAYVLITIPFTLLRKVKFELKNEMPAAKRKMIDEYGYGTNSKFLMGFKDRTWRSHGRSGYLINETIQNGWDNSQLQNNNTGDGGYTVFLGGKEGEQVTNSEILRNKFLRHLQKVYKGIKKQFNGKQSVFNWSQFQYAKGSYACIRKGQWYDIDTTEMMAPVENIYFAGEHCCEMFQGFMEGGARTGKLAAEAMQKAIAEKLTVRESATV
ncbi:flavin monoamine oxidase family protein [Pseudoflavitalea rhizosphaerae]|uniref:flavin monoamine oxidase family protein n=1 Tax=Pseudoflavitalea rhizosphaerae TaxID=1884793 RepID=UPI0013E085F9|nr:NAD(P)/FAD-dependent oxidoreductase [Pseudoflavitalea rhizosphaerae]